MFLELPRITLICRQQLNWINYLWLCSYNLCSWSLVLGPSSLRNNIESAPSLLKLWWFLRLRSLYGFSQIERSRRSGTLIIHRTSRQEPLSSFLNSLRPLAHIAACLSSWLASTRGCSKRGLSAPHACLIHACSGCIFLILAGLLPLILILGGHVAQLVLLLVNVDVEPSSKFIEEWLCEGSMQIVGDVPTTLFLQHLCL